MSNNRVITPINELQPSELRIGGRFAMVRGNITSRAFAKSLGVHPNSITNYEADKRFPDLRVLTQLIEDYGVNLNWLLTGRGDVYDEFAKSSGDAIMANNPNDRDTPQVQKIPAGQVRLQADLRLHKIASDMVDALIENSGEPCPAQYRNELIADEALRMRKLLDREHITLD